MSRVTLAVLGALGQTQVKYVRPVRFGAARGLVGEVYQQVERDFGVLAPPMTLHSPAPDVLAAAWTMLRETMLVPGQVDRVVKEAMATAVSVANTCPFCITVHSKTFGATANTPAEVSAATDWANASVHANTATTAKTPFTATQAPEYLGLTTMMQYLNRMANVFLCDVPMPPGTPRVALGGVMAVLGSLIRAAAAKNPTPGTSLALLPDAPLPDDLAWAAPSPTVASALSRATAVLDAAGTRSIPDQVRGLVHDQLSTWQGNPMGISRTWTDDLVAGLSPAHQPAARLALLVAFASYQVDKHAVADFRRTAPSDAALIDLTAWSAMAAARRISEWSATDTVQKPEPDASKR